MLTLLFIALQKKKKIGKIKRRTQRCLIIIPTFISLFLMQYILLFFFFYNRTGERPKKFDIHKRAGTIIGQIKTAI